MTTGTCQACGTTAPIEWFLADTEYRQLCGVLVELPKEIQKVVFHYLALFKPQSGRAMAPAKATRLLGEIRELIAKGHIQHSKKVARPCPPVLWAQAMEQMVERRERLTLPLPNHNYLKTIAWDLADREDARLENAQKHIVRNVPAKQRLQTVLSPFDQYIQGLREDKPSQEEMAEWRKQSMEWDDED